MGTILEELQILVSFKDKYSAGFAALSKGVADIVTGFNLAHAAAAYFAVAIGSKVAGAIGDAAKSLYDAGAEIVALRRAFSAIAGDAEGAAEMMGFVRKEANRLGLEFYSAIEAYKELAAAAKGTALEGKTVRDVFVAISEAGSALGLSSDKVSRSLYAITQMISKGTVQTEELRRQLAEHLPGAFQVAAKSMGLTQTELGKLLDQGKVFATDMVPKLAEAYHNLYGVVAVQATHDARQEMNRLITAWKDFKIEVSELGYMDQAVVVVRELAAALKSEELKRVAGSIAEIGASIALYLIKGLKEVKKELDDIRLIWNFFTDTEEFEKQFRKMFSQEYVDIMKERYKQIKEEGIKQTDEMARAIGKATGVAIENYKQFDEAVKSGVIVHTQSAEQIKNAWGKVPGEFEHVAEIYKRSTTETKESIDLMLRQMGVWKASEIGVQIEIGKTIKALQNYKENILLMSSAFAGFLADMRTSAPMQTAEFKKMSAIIDQLVMDGVHSVEKGAKLKEQAELNALQRVVDAYKRQYAEIGQQIDEALAKGTEGKELDKLVKHMNQIGVAMVNAEAALIEKQNRLRTDANKKRIDDIKNMGEMELGEREVILKRALVMLSSHEEDGLVVTQEATEQRRILELTYLKDVVKAHKEAYDEILKAQKEGIASPEDVSNIKQQLIEAETDYAEKLLEIRKERKEKELAVEEAQNEEVQAQRQLLIDNLSLLEQQDLENKEKYAEARRKVELDNLAIIVQETKAAYEELSRSASTDPEKLAQAHTEFLTAQTAFVQKQIEIEDEKNKEIERLEKEHQEEMEALRKVNEEKLELEYEQQIQNIEKRYKDEKISYEKMVKEKLIAERDFLKAKYEAIVKSTEEVIDLFDRESSEYKKAMLEREKAQLALKRVQDELNILITKGIEAYERETESIKENTQSKEENITATEEGTEETKKNTEARRENASAIEEQTKSIKLMNANVKAQEIAIEGATDEQNRYLQTLADKLVRLNELLDSSKGSLNLWNASVLMHIRDTERAYKDLIEQIKETIKQKGKEKDTWTSEPWYKKIIRESGLSLSQMRRGGEVLPTWLASGGLFVRYPHGQLPGADTKQDYVNVKARGGEWFINNEAVADWTRTFGAAFMHGINQPWGSFGKKIKEAIAKGASSDNIKMAFGGGVKVPPPAIAFATGGEVQDYRKYKQTGEDYRDYLRQGTEFPVPRHFGDYAPRHPNLDVRELGRVELEVGGRAHPVFSNVSTIKKLVSEIRKANLMRGRRWQ